MSILSILGENKFWNVKDSGAGMAHHNIRCTGAHSKRTNGVMANTGFGSVSLVIDGQKYVLPAKALKKNGCVKKSWAGIVSARDTKALLSRGAILA